MTSKIEGKTIGCSYEDTIFYSDNRIFEGLDITSINTVESGEEAMEEIFLLYHAFHSKAVGGYSYSIRPVRPLT